MTMRRHSQKRADDTAFPVRVYFIVPRGDFQISEALDWLERQCGTANYAWHSGKVRWPDSAVALYFRHPRAALAFAQAFPGFMLADDLDYPSYTTHDSSSVRYEIEAMCNLYNITRSQDAIRQLFKGLVITDRLGNLEPGSVYPNQWAPIVRHGSDGGLEIVRARWGCRRHPLSSRRSGIPG